MIVSVTSGYGQRLMYKAEIQKNIRLKNDALQASESGKLATQGNLGQLAKRIQKAEGELASLSFSGPCPN